MSLLKTKVKSDNSNFQSNEKLIESLEKIEEAFVKASHVANSAEYDRSVWIKALSVARKKFEAVPQEGDACEYLDKVRKAIAELAQEYNDSEGQYTNGRAMITQVLDYLYQVSHN